MSLETRGGAIRSDSRAAAEIAVIGTGYVGLTTGACFAHLGHRVICADVDSAKIGLLRRGGIPIYEPGLHELVRAGLASQRLSFVTDSSQAAAEADFVYLCVPTPQDSRGAVDLSFLSSAVADIAVSLRAGAVVVNKSTVPTGSTLLVEQALNRDDVHVASNPEFLREGSAVSDFLNPDRVVIGADDPAVAARVAELYAGVDTVVLDVDPATAETVKYAANAFLATKLSFVNAIAAVCESVGADVNGVLAALGHDRRIGPEFLSPGPGWGGSCLPKDTRALIAVAAEAGYDFSLLRGVLEANDEQFDRVVAKVTDRVSLEGARVAMLGLAFKAGTDDVRASPALEIARRLTAAGAHVQAYDPAVPASAVARSPGVTVADDPYQACEGAAAVVVVTEWDEFRDLDIGRVAAAMAEHHVVDARNILERGAWTRCGFSYSGIGVAPSHPIASAGASDVDAAGVDSAGSGDRIGVM